MKSAGDFTAAQEILLAAAALDEEQTSAFSEWDLTVAAWRRNPNKFGCRGYERDYPDHKRVMMEIMGTTKKENPLRRGWIRKVRPNYYKLTAVGKAEALTLSAKASIEPVARPSAEAQYEALSPYVNHPAFLEYTKNTEEPKTWLRAASFLGLRSNDALHFEDQLRTLVAAAELGLAWFENSGEEVLRRGATGGGRSIGMQEVEKLKRFAVVIQERFSVQIQAIRRTAKK